MIEFDVYVRARTSDDRWATVNAAYLDDLSFRRLVLSELARSQIVMGLKAEGNRDMYTALTKAEAEET